MKRKMTLSVVLLMAILVVCLAGCTTNFKFADLALTKDNVNYISVTFGGRKETNNNKKIENILKELNTLDVAPCKEKVSDDLFADRSIALGVISMKINDKNGTFDMIFLETSINAEKVTLLKCEANDGMKLKKMPKGIYQLNDTDAVKAMFSKIFYNYC